MSAKLLLAVLFFCAFRKVITAEHSPENIPCAVRDLGKGNKVCVCNGTYCDTVNPLPPFPSRMFNMYTSDKEGARFLFSRKNFVSWTNPKSIKVTVNSSETYQTMIGFGGCLSDAATINIHSLDQETQNKVLASYFSELGIEYGLLRIPIGGTDYSNRPYTLDDNKDDTSLSQFKLSFEDINFKIPDLQKLKKLSRKRIQLIATAWTAPPWMKTNDDYKGVGVLKDEHFGLWSKYHLRFLEEYDKRGLPIWALTTGYQPSTGFIPFYPYNCMGWTPVSQSQWISQYLGPDLENSPYNKTQIIVLDGLRVFLPLWPKIMFSNHKTKAYSSGIGVQWYWDFILPSRLLDLTHADFPDKFILGTDASFNKMRGFAAPVILGSWSRAEEYAESIINDINHWVSGWMDSNLVLDLKGGPSWAENFADAAIIVNTTANEFYKQPMFYAMGHFSKFVPKGSLRIEIKVSKSGIKATGFRTPQGNVVIILLNKKPYEVPITILGPKTGNANISLPRKSLMTIIYRDKKKFPLFKVTNFWKIALESKQMVNLTTRAQCLDRLRKAINCNTCITLKLVMKSVIYKVSVWQNKFGRQKFFMH